MLELRLTSYTRARVWLDEPLPLDTIEDEVMEQRQGALPSTLRGAMGAGIELLVGGRFAYGLLVGHFAPEAQDSIVVQVPLALSLGVAVPWALASEVIYNGVPPEYGAAILGIIPEAAKVLGGGCLRFGPGAHGLVGSSPWMFSILAGIVVDLLGIGTQGISSLVATEIIERRRHK